MSNLQNLLIDILDTDDANILQLYSHHYSTPTSHLDFDSLLQDQRVWECLAFGELWKELLGVYPSFPIAKTFLSNNVANIPQPHKRAFNMNRFITFLTSIIPFWAPQATDNNTLDKAMHVISTSYNAHHLLSRKLSFRYGIIPTNASLLSLITGGGLCSPSALSGLYELCDAIGVQRPSKPIKSLKTLQIFHMQCIEMLKIHQRNPFNGLTRNLDPRICFRTIFDAFAYCFLEPSVVLMIAGAHAFTSLPPNAKTTELMSACLPNNRLLLLTESNPMHASAPTNLLVFYHPLVLHYAPKLAMTHVQLRATVAITKVANRTINNISASLCYDKMWMPLFDTSDKILVGLSKVFFKNLLSYNVDIQTLVFQQFMLRYYAKHSLDIVSSFNPKPRLRNAVLLIDSRNNIMSIVSLLITFYNLSNDAWSLVIVCNVNNIEYYKTCLGEHAVRHIDFITEFYMAVDGYTIDMYNNLLKSTIFWERISANYAKVLLIQDDGMIIRKGLEDAEFFGTCKYIGAPWCPNLPENKALFSLTQGRMVGNGGLSLRDTKAMLAVCMQHKDKNKELHFNSLQQEPEDVFFARHCVDVGSISEAVTFSTEQVISPRSYGFHKFWPYHQLQDVCRVFNSILGESHAIDVNAFRLEYDKEGKS